MYGARSLLFFYGKDDAYTGLSCTVPLAHKEVTCIAAEGTGKRKLRLENPARLSGGH